MYTTLDGEALKHLWKVLLKENLSTGKVLTTSFWRKRLNKFYMTTKARALACSTKPCNKNWLHNNNNRAFASPRHFHVLIFHWNQDVPPRQGFCFPLLLPLSTTLMSPSLANLWDPSNIFFCSGLPSDQRTQEIIRGSKRNLPLSFYLFYCCLFLSFHVIFHLNHLFFNLDRFLYS